MVGLRWHLRQATASGDIAALREGLWHSKISGRYQIGWSIGIARSASSRVTSGAP
jgi:hypothetical protein